MGSFNSKPTKTNFSNGDGDKDKSKDKIEISDPRSPTGQIVRTPIIVEKDKDDLSENHGKPSLLKQKFLKTMKLDPRSPTDGISRTPIYLDQTPIQKANHCCNCESPLSIYSGDFSTMSSLTDITTPSEPSVNVSGFDKVDGNCTKNTEYFDSLSDNENIADTNMFNEKTSCFTKTPLRVSSKPSTAEARKILNEILSSKEFEKELIMPQNKHETVSKNKNPSIHCDYSENKFGEKKQEKVKYRTPLSNITLASNSPNQINTMKKSYAKCKIFTDSGLENIESLKGRQIAEWDKNKTVII